MGGPFSFVTAVVGSGASVGLAIIAATVLAVDSLRSHTAQSGNLETPFYLLVLGTLAGIAAAAFAAWRLLSSLESSYRRGALSIVCSFATVLLMLVCIPVHQLLGRTGLLLLLGVAALAAVLLAHRARRMGTGQ